MQPDPVVEDLDVVGDGEPGAGPAGEGLPVIHLVLQGAGDHIFLMAEQFTAMSGRLYAMEVMTPVRRLVSLTATWPERIILSDVLSRTFLIAEMSARTISARETVLRGEDGK